MSEYDYHRVFYRATATSPDYVGIDAVVDAAKADERAKCRAELRDKIDELIDTVPDWAVLDRIFRWANGTEAFGGD